MGKGTEALADLAFLGLEEPRWVTCPCGNKALSLDHSGRCVRCTERDEAARTLARSMVRACIPEPMRWVRPDHPDLAVILGLAPHHESLGRRLMAQVENPRLRTLTLLGNSAEGKTHLALAMLMPKVTDSLFVDAAALTAGERQHKLGRGEAPLVERAFRARVLVLDELDHPAEATRLELLKRLLQDRFTNGRRTIITSGLTGAELEKIYGSGHARRMGIGHGPRGDVMGESKVWNLTADRHKRVVAANLTEIRERATARGQSAADIAAWLQVSEHAVQRVLDSREERAA